MIVPSLVDALVVTFTVDAVILVDVTGIVAVAVFGSLVVVVAAAVLVGCDVTGDNGNVEGSDVNVYLINCLVFSSKVVAGQTVALVLFHGTVEDVSLVVVAVATVASSGSK